MGMYQWNTAKKKWERALVGIQLSTLLKIFPQIIKWFFLKKDKKYLYMQKVAYQHAANNTTYNADKKNDFVVGSYDEQNKWEDYDKYLMKYVDKSFQEKIALDFACGPGRNIVKYNKWFKRIDGCDISQNNLNNAKENLTYHKIPLPNLYVTNGDDLGMEQENYYDFIFSSIAMQHICVHKIRYSILTCMYKALKKGGRISIQMAFGTFRENSAGYYENCFNATGTNGSYDTRVEDPNEVKKDLENIGFRDFEYWIRPAGPGDADTNWIFFTASK